MNEQEQIIEKTTHVEQSLLEKHYLHVMLLKRREIPLKILEFETIM
jgi:hypothetical protein